MARGHPVGKGSGDEADSIAALWAGPPRKKQQDSESADDGDGNDFYFCGAGENRKKMAAVFGDDDGYGGGSAAGGEPVAPANDESGIIAESAARKIVLAAAAGNCGAKFCHGRGAGKCIEPAEDPDCEKHPHIGEKRRDVARRSNDAGGDGVADSSSHAKPHPENLEQAPAPDHGRRANCGRGFR